MRVSSVITDILQIINRDHGSLQGLVNDDHAQYLNTARHDLPARHTLGTVVAHDAFRSLTDTFSSFVGKSLQVLRVNSGETALEPFALSVGTKIAAAYTDVTITNSSAETNLVSVIIPAGTLSTNNVIRATVRLSEITLQDQVTSNVTFRLKYGGTTVASFKIEAPQAIFTAGTGEIVCYLFATGATNSQEGSGMAFIEIPPAVGADTFKRRYALFFGTSAIDSTTDQTLLVTAQLGRAAANEHLTMAHYLVEKII